MNRDANDRPDRVEYLPVNMVIGAGRVVAFTPRNGERLPVVVPASENSKDIGLAKISGSSLEDHGILDGEYLIYTKHFDPKPQPGRIYVVKILTTGETLAKKIVLHGRHMLILRASGGGIADMHLPPEDVEVIGLGIGHTRMFPHGLAGDGA